MKFHAENKQRDDKVREKIPMSETDEGIPKVYKNWQVNKKSATSCSIS